MAARKRRPRELDDVEDGEILDYHPITTSFASVRVRIVGEAYALGCGDRIVKAVRLNDGSTVRPWLGALSRTTLVRSVDPEKKA